MSQKELAARVGISKVMVSVVETRNQPMSPQSLGRLSAALGVEPQFLELDTKIPLEKAVRSLIKVVREGDLGNESLVSISTSLEGVLEVANTLSTILNRKIRASN